jgi:glutathione S-transferase
MYTLYGKTDSGNCYKARLALEQLRIPYRWIEVHNARTPDFLAKNANGKVPTLELEDGGFLSESNAILWYLAEGTELAPAGRLGRARALQWMFFEQYSHEPYVAVARSIVRHEPVASPRRAELPQLRERGHQALAVMERQLEREPYFVDGAYSIADIALFAYTHCASDGGIELTPYPAVRGWLRRVYAQPGFVPMR